MVSNLLTNANKYTKDDVRLSCGIEPDGEHFRIVVSYNGVGIREEDRKRIFEPFFQAMDNKPGTGIGLNIVKNIVDLHHGTISLDSEVGKGTTFTVVLPVRQESQEDIQGSRAMEVLESENTSDEQNPPRSSESSYSSSSEYPRSSKDTMLIVDDSEDMVALPQGQFLQPV